MNEQMRFERAQTVIPGGVNSPVRSFASVGGTPICIEKAEGAHLTTADGRQLLDFCLSWGPLILGHADPDVVEAVRAASARGLSFGCNHPGETEMAELITMMVPYADKLRLVNSGTEAVMTALRLVRGATGRDKIVKFEGCYHGHSDSLLAGAGSGILTGGLSASEGVPRSMVEDIHVLPYNDTGAVEEIFGALGSRIAGLIVEPVAGNMGLVPPAEGFLPTLRRLTAEAGALLVFDEVITGFRFAATTYGVLCGITPDLTVLGKIIGGGMPIGGIAGPASLMDLLAPLGGVYQAGTLSGNPVAVAAGIATLKKLRNLGPKFYTQLADLTETIASNLEAAAGETGIPLSVPRMGSAFTPFFAPTPPGNLVEAKACDTETYKRFFHGMLRRGVYLPPSPFELAFIGAAHKKAEGQRFTDAAAEVFAEIRID